MRDSVAGLDMCTYSKYMYLYMYMYACTCTCIYSRSQKKFPFRFTMDKRVIFFVPFSPLSRARV